MVSSLLRAEGFEVYDLGANVPVDEFVRAVRVHQPDILALSALLSTTAPETRRVIGAIREEGLHDGVKVIVGGAAMSADLANDVGADGYDPTAPGAVVLARDLLGV
jgi:5-methyltetrahydrofolate--homocysteine methyltransferase